jgi:hypothetical protein
MDWFEQITGFKEEGWERTRARLKLDGAFLVHERTGQRHATGRFEMVCLQRLRREAQAGPTYGRGRLRLSTVTGDARKLHAEPAFAGALFQVASQFNALEMVSPEVSPEDGVTRYAFDRTQGPACAMAAGAATIYRNYLVPVDGKVGQCALRQLDGLADIGLALSHAIGVPVATLWNMRNGYALCTRQGLQVIGEFLSRSDPQALDNLRGLLQVGAHRGVSVTDMPSPHTVTQVFCSAMPVAYGVRPAKAWEPLARLVLEAAYEATLWEAVLNRLSGGTEVVLLTLLGGGAFGNEESWIIDALRRALILARDCPLDVRLVSYDGQISTGVQALIKEFE